MNINTSFVSHICAIHWINGSWLLKVRWEVDAMQGTVVSGTRFSEILRFIVRLY